MKTKKIDIVFICLIFVLCLHSLALLRGDNKIVGDGAQNVQIATNLMQYHTFSSKEDGISDMTREPAWPFITAVVLKSLHMQSISADILVSDHANIFENINIVFYSMIIVIIFLFVLRELDSYIFATLAMALALVILNTIPRLIFYYNNEALCSLLLLFSSILFLQIYRHQKKSPSILLGLCLGLISLTKAQYLYIVMIPIFTLYFIDKKLFLLNLCSLLLVVSPWIVRNYILFDKYTIAERGKVVASVRYIMTVEPSSSEYPCMAYAFLAPNLRPLVHGITDIKLDDFQRHGRCERFNREICYDMGTHKIPCSAFAEDASPTVAWNNKIQYFYRGYAAGEAMAMDKLSLQDIAPFNVETVAKYIKTFPIFSLRGLGFSDYPLLILVMALCMSATLFTPLWPFALLAIISHLFHVVLTHNIARYHGVELPIMIICTFYCIKRVSCYISSAGTASFNKIKTRIKRRY